ncbi:MAG TPA: histidine kinase [Nitrosomonas sp.]|nr:histidine kinase [Nitrosomonas sp.]HMW20303.1 histidine kinase [Nitrosomonas sp.]HMW68489.1 histidine kinase [Nitrosomonas sp.]HMY60512.1 histidine kinase [Nitrosomonas sp.]HMY90273.1 histidine kinase [Nitrosomonas sp.]
MTITKDDRKISIIGGLLLLGLTLTTGFTVYNAMRQQIETVLDRGLTGSLDGKALLFETRIGKGIEDARALALRPFIIQFMQELNENINNREASNNLDRNVNSLTQIGFSAAVIYDKNDNILSQVGTFSSDENPVITLTSERNAKLIWDNVFVLRVAVDVINNNNRIGTIVTETKLPNLTRSFMDIQSGGKSVEFLICAKMPEKQLVLTCLIRNPTSVRYAYLDISSKEQNATPKGMALIGKSGVASTLDYRGIPVIEAYTSLPSLGLLMTLKLDQEELFMPINDKLKDSALYLIILIIAEIILLNWFIGKLITSEKNAQSSKRKAEEYSDELTLKETVLRKKLNEITCLYEIRREMEFEISIDEVCHKILKLLPPALQFPKTSTVEIIFNNKRFTSKDLDEESKTEIGQTPSYIEILETPKIANRKSIFNIYIQSNIYIDIENQGHLRVYYIENVPSSLTEEQIFIDAIARDLEKWIALRKLESTLISVADDQVHKIGQELHDNLGQQIAAVSFQASALELQIRENKTPHETILELAASIAAQTQGMVTSIKQVSKILLPFELEANGLITAFYSLTTQISETYNINCVFVTHLKNDRNIDSVVGLNLYRVAQEAINNAIFHGKAKNISISLSITNNELKTKFIHLTISNDGKGINEETIYSSAGMGIKIMQYRAKQLNGKLTILKHKDGGIEINFIVPILESDKS